MGLTMVSLTNLYGVQLGHWAGAGIKGFWRAPELAFGVPLR